MERKKVTIDGNEAAAYVAFNTNEVIAIAMPGLQLTRKIFGE